MCSTPEVRLAMLRAAIDEVALAAHAGRSGHTQAEDLAERLAGLWNMIAELDPALASRLRGYGPDAELWRIRAVVAGAAPGRTAWPAAQLPTISTSRVAVTSGCRRTRT
jgi:hypothetical protein